MFAAISSLFGGKAQSAVPNPPPTTVIGVRIPVDGSPPHLLPLTTTPTAGIGRDDFLFHVPNLHQHWKSDLAWDFRDVIRLDILPDAHIPRSMHLQQQDDLRRVLYGTGAIFCMSEREHLHLRQRHLLYQRYFVLRLEQQSCAGTYYLFYSLAVDDLPQNSNAPRWFRDASFEGTFHGDLFLVKLAPEEKGENGWAVYEDVAPAFLEVLACESLESFGRELPWSQRLL